MGALGLRPTGWGSLVGELREVRRAIEAGVIVEVGGQELCTPSDFFSWVDKRYHVGRRIVTLNPMPFNWSAGGMHCRYMGQPLSNL